MPDSLNYDKKVYPKEFFVYPFSKDRKLNILEFNIEKPLRNKLKIEAVVYDNYNTITKERYKLFYKKTEDNGWREYNSSLENLLSGFSYDFSVLKEGYNISILNEISIPLNQDTLYLEFILTPKRSQIKFIKNDCALNIFVNGKDFGFYDFNGLEMKKYRFGKSFFIDNGINKFRFVDEKTGIDYEIKKEILKDRDYKLLFKLENNRPVVKIDILEK